MAAPNLPHHRLTVDVWNPESRVQAVPPATHRPERGKWVPKALTAVAVVGLHTSLAAWLLISTLAPGLKHPFAEPLVLLGPLSSAPAAPDTAPPDVFVPDRFAAPPVVAPLPRLPSFGQAPSEIAISIAPSTDVVISDANTREVALAVGSCRTGAVRPALSVMVAVDITLLARVEKDGRISDTKIEVGSGAPVLDQAAQHCLAAHAVLTPHRVSGAPVASWQRVHWPSV